MIAHETELGLFVPALRGGTAFVPTTPKKILGIENLLEVVEKATLSLSKLDSAILRLADPFILTESLISIEAVTSSRIEGTHSGLEDLIDYVPSNTFEDLREVKNCADAFKAGETILNNASSVMSVAAELHKILMQGHPTIVGGILKTSQNYTIKQDGSVFFYTPPHYLEQSLSAFESFTMAQGELPELIRQAISHWIFEQIHPFPDGNGRVGRLLIPLLLKYKGFTDTSFGLVSEAIEQNKLEYIRQFELLHQTKDWIPWCRFMLNVLMINAEKNINRINSLETLRKDYMTRISYKSKGSALYKVIPYIFKKPRFTRLDLRSDLKLSPRGAEMIVSELTSLDIVSQANKQSQRNVIFKAHDVINILLK